MVTPWTGALKVSVASWGDDVKLTDKCMCQCAQLGDLGPIARLKIAGMGLGFLAPGSLVNIRAIGEWDLNDIRKK